MPASSAETGQRWSARLRLRGRARCHHHGMSLSCSLSAADVSVTYRAGHRAAIDTRLDRVAAGDVLAGLPVREFRWYKGRRHYSGWYWAATSSRLVAHESRLELARTTVTRLNTLARDHGANYVSRCQLS